MMRCSGMTECSNPRPRLLDGLCERGRSESDELRPTEPQQLSSQYGEKDNGKTAHELTIWQIDWHHVRRPSGLRVLIPEVLELLRHRRGTAHLPEIVCYAAKRGPSCRIPRPASLDDFREFSTDSRERDGWTLVLLCI